MHFAALGNPLAECCSYPVGFTSVPVTGTFRNENAVIRVRKLDV